MGQQQNACGTSCHGGRTWCREQSEKNPQRRPRPRLQCALTRRGGEGGGVPVDSGGSPNSATGEGGSDSRSGATPEGALPSTLAILKLSALDTARLEDPCAANLLN